MNNSILKSAYGAALNCFPGGVNSPVRAFKAVGTDPIFIKSGKGARISSIAQRQYIDYVGSWGPMILGHAREEVVEAVQRAAERGLSFGAPTEGETELAELIKLAFPGMERMRFVSTGTEATMSAVRLARGYSQRDLIIKIDGGYHGHADALLSSAGSGVATFGLPGCPGIPEGVAKDTLIVPFNDTKAIEACFAEHQGKIACIIVEPVCGNMGVVLPKAGYLEFLRDICSKNSALLIFDEVMTGFRACFGGASKVYNVMPDLFCLGKVVGGGMPIAAYGGKKEIMALIAPDGAVYQAGTLSGNPISVAAGIATLKILSSNEGLYSDLLAQSEKLELGIKEGAKKHGLEVSCNRFGSMMTTFFTKGPVYDYESAKTSDLARFTKWFNLMLEEGIYLAPSQFEAAFVSMAHGDAEIEATIAAANKVMQAL
jgi:glutamate-1-semialdehyde 2,1-aminomutase